MFFIFQSALVRTHNVKLHRRAGWFGAGLGVVIPVLGIWTAIVMDRFLFLHFHFASVKVFFSIQLWDITSFTLLVGDLLAQETGVSSSSCPDRNMRAHVGNVRANPDVVAGMVLYRR